MSPYYFDEIRGDISPTVRHDEFGRPVPGHEISEKTHLEVYETLERFRNERGWHKSLREGE